MRRTIRAVAIIVLAAAALSPALPQANAPAGLKVNQARLDGRLQELARFGKNAEGGIDRIAFSDADVQARAYIQSLMRDLGLAVSVDAAGNIIGALSVPQSQTPPIAMGSHIDTVPNGGMFDGAIGALAALECVQVIKENAYAHRHPLEVIVFADEEGGSVGSKAMAGELAEESLAALSLSGLSIRDGLRRLGGDPERLASAKRVGKKFKAYLELHVEQGGRLEAKRLPIGIVEGIVGIRRWEVTVEGFANHAGTTPMADRQDALLAAAHFIILVNRLITAAPGNQVGTVGRIQAEPGVPNVIPGRVRMTLELRDVSEAKISTLFGRIVLDTRAIEKQTGTKFSFALIPPSSIAALTDKNVNRCLAEAAKELSLETLVMPSGAGHDAQNMARLAPVGMIFIPSRGGISHSPKEFSSAEDIGNGANLLLRTFLKIDRGCF